jgi:prepilin-type N-terminal cleavage/methylation domain-containing protein
LIWELSLNIDVSQSGRRRRPGFTLMEIMLVLAVLVVIAALTLPALDGPMENHRLRVSGDVVRVQWSHARVKAMETGRTYVFKYQPEQQNFKLEPWYMEDDYLESDVVLGFGGGPMAGGAGGIQAVDASSPDGIATPTTTELGELPEGVTFVGSETELDDRSAFLSATTAGGEEDLLWSSPIFFYPDGTSSTARLLMMNRRSRYVMVSVRGLTGVVLVSDLLTEEEIQ